MPMALLILPLPKDLIIQNTMQKIVQKKLKEKDKDWS